MYLWPQEYRDHRPLVLRSIVLPHGKQDVFLLTDVLDPGQLTDEEAATFFGMRWGEEVCQADDIPRCGLYPSAGSSHSERGGAAAPGPLVPGAPSRHRRATAMRSDSERPVPPRPRAA